MFDMSANDCCVFCGCVMAIVSSASAASLCYCRFIPIPVIVSRSRSPFSPLARSPSVSPTRLLLLFLVCAPFLVSSPSFLPLGAERPISLCNATIYRILPVYCSILCWLSWSPRSFPFSSLSHHPSSHRASCVVNWVTRQWDSVISCVI